MIIYRHAEPLRKALLQLQQNDKSVGFAPTMGALHPGHISLFEAAKKGNDITVCSIFVNPTQFNDPKDFEKYPVTIEKDIDLLYAAGVDILFLPGVQEIYPQGTSQLPAFDLGFLETVWEGQHRPGHFQGVCQVMYRLLDIVQPDDLYMGAKDYQQCMVVKHLLEEMKLPTVFHTCPTLREPDGLAMSSRNVRLGPEGRKKVTAISKVLQHISQNIQTGDLTALQEAGIAELQKQGFIVDYLGIADADTLAPVNIWDGKRSLVVLVAAFMEGVRLIDNVQL